MTRSLDKQQVELSVGNFSSRLCGACWEIVPGIRRRRDYRSRPLPRLEDAYQRGRIERPRINKSQVKRRAFLVICVL